jgi:hypothetical protein
VLNNAGIDPVAHLRAAHETATGALGSIGGPALIDAKDDKIIHELTFDLPDVGLQPPNAPTGVAIVALDLPNVPTFGGNPDEPEDETPERPYPLQECGRASTVRQVRPANNLSPTRRGAGPH